MYKSPLIKILATSKLIQASVFIALFFSFIKFFYSSASLLSSTKEKRIFKNPFLSEDKVKPLEFLYLRCFSGKWGAGSKSCIPQEKVRSKSIYSPPKDTHQITWLGHSTVLIQTQGFNILTDPFFSNYAAPLPFLGPKRYTPAALKLQELPPIDYVLVSHNHYDHLDRPSVKSIGKNATWLVPLGLKAWFQKLSIESVIELNWWDSCICDGIEFTCTPSQHWSKRTPFDAYSSLWSSWALKTNDFSFWFAGDTGYNCVQFKEIGRELGPFDCCAIPIGSYNPRSFMRSYHVNPQEALKIHQEVQSKFSFAIHWGTLVLSQEARREPVDTLSLLCHNTPPSFPFISSPIGKTLSFS